MGRALSTVFATSGSNATVSAVFCHQKPEVSFNYRSNRCELGDILFVHVHFNAAGDFVFGQLAAKPHPTAADIAGITNLCRCGTYPRIRRAIVAAAKKMEGVNATVLSSGPEEFR